MNENFDNSYTFSAFSETVNYLPTLKIDFFKSWKSVIQSQKGPQLSIDSSYKMENNSYFSTYM